MIINATQAVGNYWLRVGTGGRCDGPNANAANIGSIIRYAGAEDANPNSTAAAPLPAGCYDEPIVPYVKTHIPQDVPEELKLTFTDTGGFNGSDLVQWKVNDVPMLIDFDKPTLQTVFEGFTGNSTWGKAENVFEVGDKWHAVSHHHVVTNVDLTLYSGSIGSFNKTVQPRPLSPIPFICTAMTSSSWLSKQTLFGVATFPL